VEAPATESASSSKASAASTKAPAASEPSAETSTEGEPGGHDDQQCSNHRPMPEQSLHGGVLQKESARCANKKAVQRAAVGRFGAGG
jgi:hypothetical protein